MSDSAQPLVSIVTPVLNAAAYVERTVQSVLTQTDADVEYIVMDGGSTDSTFELLKRYQDRLHLESGPDAGTADAINKGFALSRGSLLAFLNADDTYLPNAVATAVKAFADHPEMAVIYGEGNWVDERGEIIGRYPTGGFDRRQLALECGICQPAAFFRREAFEAVGGMDPALHYAFDWDLWIRIAQRYEMLKIDQCLATSRLHRSSKSLGRAEPALAEAVALLQRRCGYVPVPWVYRLSRAIVGEKTEFALFERRSLQSYLVSLPLGLKHNRRRPLRYAIEWGRVGLNNLSEAGKARLGLRTPAPSIVARHEASNGRARHLG
jgi:glycosyltransferase involved in cell wall biosynthesis